MQRTGTALRSAGLATWHASAPVPGNHHVLSLRTVASDADMLGRALASRELAA